MLSPLDHFAAGLFRVIRTEGSVPDEHFEENGSDRPPIDDFSVSALVEHLWSDIIRRSDQRVHLLSVLPVVRQRLLVVVLFVSSRRTPLFAVSAELGSLESTMLVQSPKSVTFMWPSLSSRMLSGFMSRWTKPRLWTYSTARMISAM